MKDNWIKIGLLFLMLVLGVAVKAQNDIVRLKNGSFIRGTIIEFFVDDHVKIQTVDGTIHVIPAADLLKAETGRGSGPSPVPRVFEIKQEGYYNVTTIGLLFGSGGFGPQINPGVYFINGWQWSPHWQTGLGLGIEYFDFGAKAPITADVRWNLLEGKVSPVVGAQLGYTVAVSRTRSQWDWWWGQQLNQRNYGGITGGLTFGFRAFAGPHMAFTMHGGYRFQKFKSRYDEQFWNGAEFITQEVVSKKYLNRFNFGFGLQFN